MVSAISIPDVARPTRAPSSADQRRPPLGKADLQKRKRDELSPSLDLSNGRNEADDEAERSGAEQNGTERRSPRRCRRSCDDGDDDDDEERSEEGGWSGGWLGSN